MHKIHVVTEPRRKVFLVRYTGEVYLYDSYREFLSYLRGDVLHNMGKSFRDVRCFYTTRWVRDYRGEYRCIDEKTMVYTYWVAHWDHKSGSIIDPAQLKKDWDEYLNELHRLRTSHKRWWYRWNNKIFEYRNGPVPFIGRHHSHRGSWYRHMKTTQERRWSLAEKEDGVRGRAKRNIHNIPNSWDDWARHNEKNWKRFRKNQWKD